MECDLAAGWSAADGLTGEWLLALAGIAFVVFGLLLIVQPFAGAMVAAWWIGAYALIFGAIPIGLSFRLRAWSRSVEPQRGLI
jgi:uncharacterized membrane protein HdeD (DUF308 family)